MSNIRSENIQIFPLAKPRKENISSRLFYEQNVTNLLRQLMDTDGFIIQSCTISNNICDDDLIFNIHGYYFKIEKGTDLGDLSTGNYIIAEIHLSETEPVEIDGQDEDDYYTGLDIICVTNLSNDDLNSKRLILFEKVNDEWTSYNSSYNKFNPQSLVISGIDGKH